jgi:deoxyribodipyrimidine photo-lyase
MGKGLGAGEILLGQVSFFFKECKLNTIIYWFRNDLRLADNPAFAQACSVAKHIIPVFIHDVAQTKLTPWGFNRQSAHRQHFLNTALAGLGEKLTKAGSALITLQGDTTQVLTHLSKQLDITEIYCERIAAPEEQSLLKQLGAQGLQIKEFWGSSMLDLDTLPFAIDQLADTFSTFRNQIEKKRLRARKVCPTPQTIPSLPESFQIQTHQAEHLSDSYLPQTLDPYPQAIASFPYHVPEFFGAERTAQQHLEKYFSCTLPHTYKETRNLLTGVDYSTKFSPWLAVGALSAPLIVQALNAFEAQHGASKSSYWIWFELLWRDYFRLLHLKYGKMLYRKQGLASQESPAVLYANKNPSKRNENFKRWCDGQTGEPLIDAAMHELQATGYLSNRLRQVVASYLIYDLAGDWRAGAAWFETQLIDYDVYSNQGNWLYIAGLGTDPRGGRKFNPHKQTQDHDPQGTYRTSWGCA